MSSAVGDRRCAVCHDEGSRYDLAIKLRAPTVLHVRHGVFLEALFVFEKTVIVTLRLESAAFVSQHRRFEKAGCILFL